MTEKGLCCNFVCSITLKFLDYEFSSCCFDCGVVPCDDVVFIYKEFSCRETNRLSLCPFAMGSRVHDIDSRCQYSMFSDAFRLQPLQ